MGVRKRTYIMQVLETDKELLQECLKIQKALIKGDYVTAYTIGSRSLQKQGITLPQVRQIIKDLLDEIDDLEEELEAMDEGRCRKPRRAVGVLPRTRSGLSKGSMLIPVLRPKTSTITTTPCDSGRGCSTWLLPWRRPQSRRTVRMSSVSVFS